MVATIYMILGRLVLVLQGERNAIIKPRWITKVFVTGDVLSFFMQEAGAGLLSAAKTQTDVNRANYIIVGGLAIQILFFGFCIAVTAVFHWRMRQLPTRRSQAMQAPWQGLLCALYISSTMILIRSAYRVAEYAQGTDGELQRKELWLYIFDSLPIIVVTIVFLVFHPGRVVNKEALSFKSSSAADSGIDLEGEVSSGPSFRPRPRERREW
jgi:hypothetical protein